MCIYLDCEKWVELVRTQLNSFSVRDVKLRCLVFTEEECGYSFSEARKKDDVCEVCKMIKMIEKEKRERRLRRVSQPSPALLCDSFTLFRKSPFCIHVTCPDHHLEFCFYSFHHSTLLHLLLSLPYHSSCTHTLHFLYHLILFHHMLSSQCINCIHKYGTLLIC